MHRTGEASQRIRAHPPVLTETQAHAAPPRFCSCALGLALLERHALVHRQLGAAEPQFAFRPEKIQFFQEASIVEPGRAKPTPLPSPCVSQVGPACKSVITAPPSRDALFFNRPTE